MDTMFYTKIKSGSLDAVGTVETLDMGAIRVAWLLKGHPMNEIEISANLLKVLVRYLEKVKK